MVSRKNINYKAQQDAKCVPHYGIRKLSIGVASVLLGTVFYMQNSTVHADVNPTVSAGNDSVNVVDKNSGTSSSAGVTGTSTGVGSVNSAGSGVSAGDVTNSAAPSQVSGSLNESATKQASNAALAASEPESATPASQVNVGTDNSNAIFSLPPASHHQASAAGGNPNNDQQNQENVFDINNNAVNNISNSQLSLSLQQSSNEASVQQIDLQYNGKTVSNGSSLNYQLDSAYTYGISSQFTLTPDQLSKKQVIHLARISFQSSGNYQPGVLARSGSLVLNGQSIGSVSVQVPNTPIGLNLFSYQHQPYFDIIVRIDSPVEVQGNQVLSVLYPELFALGYNQSGFRGMHKSGSNVIMNIVTDKGIARNYVLNCKWAPVVAINDSSKYIASFWSVGDDQSRLLGILGYNYGFESDSDRIAYYQAHGKLASKMNVDEPIQIGLHVYGTQGSSLLLDMSSSVTRFTPFVSTAGSNGDVSTELLQTYYSACSHYVLKRQFEDDLSVRQLANKNYYGFAFSRQSDGSYNIYMNVTPKVYQLSSTEMSNSFNVATLRDYSTVVNCDSDPDKAFQMTQTAISNLDNIPLEFQSGIWFSFADPTRVNYYTVDQIDPVSGQVLRSASSHSYVNTVSISSQSTVKLHVITPSGVALQQVKSFTDWPNQNKHASLSIPSITGYELVSNPQSILSALHLSGTAISASTQVDYPTENTVADYYVVLQPKTESANVQIVDADESNKVLATGTVSGRFGEQIVSSADIQSKLDSLMKTGHYTLASNGFDSGADYQDGTNTVTISLKHKLDSIQRHYRVIEDLPDGTKKVIIDVEATLYKDSDVNYYTERGAYVNGVEANGCLKYNVFSIIKGAAMKGDASGDELWANVDNIPGYLWKFIDANSGYVNGVSAKDIRHRYIDLDLFNGSKPFSDVTDGTAVINPMPSRDFHITYSRRSYPVTVNYYDLTGKLVDAMTSMHKFGATVSIAPVAPTNYVLVSGQAKVDYLTGLGLNEVDFLVEPKLRTTAETKTVSRTIKVQTPDGQTNNVVQMVTFVRNGYLNQITKQTTYSPWSFGGQYQFSGYQPKSINGYTADEVPALTVTPDSLNTTVNVVYHQMPVVYSVDYQLANGTVVKNVSATPDGDGMIHLTAPQGYQLLTTVTNVQVGSSSRKLTVLVLPDEQTYTAYSTLPSSVTEPLTKTITRTINITMPNGRVRKVVQQVHFVRTATVVANGKITYSDWTGVGQTSFDRLFVPKRRGYRLVMTDKQGQTLTGVNQMVVDPTMDNVVINVKYVK